ncbi:MAG: precorrin-6y C5,15-methyltransferase (decarboxylating) subunit CbiE [Archaeoglobales archaeon]|nr:precorrin-6y C5,15-methyltransferase (decarboxylating) subunit CbiE [Archaeoglobales archaeon]
MLNIVGVGICEGQITERASKLISQAEVVFGSRRALMLASKFISGEFVEIKKFEDETYREIEKLAEKRNVVVLSTGDPMVAGLGKRLKGNVEPGISSIQLALARLKEDLCSTVVIDAHARKAEDELELIERRNLLILADRGFDPSLLGKRRAALIEDICGNERISFGRAEELRISSDYSIVFVWK